MGEEQLIPESWLDLSLAAGQELDATCGLLWWRRAARTSYVVDEALLEKMGGAGVGEEILAKLRQHALGEFASTDGSLPAALEKALGPDFGKILAESMPRGMTPFRPKHYDFVAFEATGSLGQYLVVYPEAGLVAARMVADSPAYNPKTDSFRSFSRYILALPAR